MVADAAGSGPGGNAASPDEEGRGSQAHAAVNLLREEWKDTRKSDAELEEQILDEFAWIAEREPLTSADLIAMAEVLRFLNRHDRALGIWDTLVSRKEPGVGNYARWQRAKTLEAAERFLEAAKDWDALAASGNALAKSQNEQRAQWARTMHEDWTREQEARRAASASGDLPLVALHTNRGVIVIELFAKDVPKAAAHFLQLVDEKAYDKTCFHRVHGEFMCQGGDPKSRTHGCEFAGAGTSGREIELEVNPTHKLWRGAVAFAHKPHDPRNGSQFFIMTAPAPKLGTYTVVGHVVAGQAAADRIEYDDKVTKAVILRRGSDAAGQSTQAPDKPK